MTPSELSILQLWNELDRGWKATVIGLLITGVASLGLDVPW